jgi:hypothetical protein
MTARKKKADHRFSETPSLVDIESAMGKLSSPVLDKDLHVTARASGYISVWFEHRQDDALLWTENQLKKELDGIRNNAVALLSILGKLPGNYRDKIDRCRSTPLDQLGIETPSFSSVKVDLMWLIEATKHSDFSSTTKERPGPDKDTYAWKIAKMAARDFFTLTASVPTSMSAFDLAKYDSKKEGSHDKFGYFLADIFKIMGIRKNVETASKEVVAWWPKRNWHVE